MEPRLVSIIYGVTELYHIISLNEFMKVHFIKRKDIKVYSILVWSLFVIFLNIINHIYTSQWMNIIILFIILFACCHILYHGSIKNKIVTVMSICILGAAMEMIVACALFFLPNSQFIDLNNTTIYQMFGSITSKILLFVVVKLINRFTAFHKVNTTINYWISLLGISAGSIYIIYVITKANIVIIEPSFKFQSMILFIVVLFINLLTFFLYDQMLEKTDKNLKSALFQQQAEYYAKQYEERESSELEIRKLRHDVMNHYICINEYAKVHDCIKIKEYLDTVLTEVDNSYCKVKSGNIAVDSLINYKMSYAKKYNIQIETSLEIPKDVGIDHTTLCIVIGNAIDNAIDACKKIKEKNPKIRLYMKYINKNLYINLINPFDGDLLKDKKGKLLTTKKDKENHGLGLESIYSVVRKYHGVVETEESKNQFELKILLYGS